MNLKEIWRASSNKEPSVADLERIKNIMRSADMSANDSMAVVLTLISANQTHATTTESLSNMVSDSITTKIAKEITNQVNEQRQVASISQQLKIVGFTTLANILMLGIIFLFLPSNTPAPTMKIETPQWAIGCDTNGNLPIMAIDDKEGEKKCVLIGKDGKSARDRHGKAVTWSTN